MAMNRNGARHHKSVGPRGTRRKTEKKTRRYVPRTEDMTPLEERRTLSDRRVTDVEVAADRRRYDRRGRPKAGM